MLRVSGGSDERDEAILLHFVFHFFMFALCMLRQHGPSCPPCSVFVWARGPLLVVLCLGWEMALGRRVLYLIMTSSSFASDARFWRFFCSVFCASRLGMGEMGFMTGGGFWGVTYIIPYVEM